MKLRRSRIGRVLLMFAETAAHFSNAMVNQLARRHAAVSAKERFALSGHNASGQKADKRPPVSFGLIGRAGISCFFTHNPVPFLAQLMVCAASAYLPLHIGQ
jgi:hypothetical protein